MSASPAAQTGGAPGGATGAPPAEVVFGQLRDHFGPGMAMAARLLGRGAYEASAEGSVVRLSDGREVIDLSSYAINLFGHGNPRIVAAVQRQLGEMPSSTRLLGNPQQAGFASELLARFGAPFDHVWLGLNGADAVEATLKLVRRSSGRTRVLAVEHAFHGKSLGALGLTANPGFRTGIEDVVGHGVTHLDPTDPAAVAREVAAGDVAAVIYEPIQGEAGVRPIELAVLQQWERDARAAGAFLVSDEIQVGFGRCGALSVALADGLQPDAVLLGKPLGGGVMPLSALVATPELFAPLTKDATFHSLTFGGHPLSCAAGRAALLELDALAPSAARIAERCAQRVPGLVEAHPQVFSAIRGRGLLWGVELQTPALTGELLLFMAEHGVIATPCFSAPRVLRLFFPMVLTDEQLERVFAALEQAAVDCEEQVLADEAEAARS